MAKKQSTRRNKKAKPSEPPKDMGGGGGEPNAPDASPDMDSSAGKNSALKVRPSLSSRIDSSERDRLLRELLIEIDGVVRNGPSWKDPSFVLPRFRAEDAITELERTVCQHEETINCLRFHLYRALRNPILPDTRGGIAEMLRRAPTAWHIRTVAEESIDVLIHQSRRKERETAAMRCLGEIARLFQTGLKMRAKRSRQLREAMEHPAFLEALNRRPPKRTRGGTGGNDSIQAIFTWTEFVIIDYDKWHNPNMLPAIYAAADDYMKGFLPYAKEQWEKEDGPRRAEQWFGTKIRTNSSDPTKPKQSFGHFKKEIEENARNFIAGWLELYAPNVRDRGREND